MTISPELLNAIVALAGTVITAATTLLTKKLHAWLSVKTEETKSKAAQEAFRFIDSMLDDAVYTATKYVQKTVVDVAKKGEKWDDAAKANAKITALQTVNNILGSERAKDLAKAYNLDVSDVEKFISIKIESALAARRFE
jgi:hypothetical protein